MPRKHTPVPLIDLFAGPGGLGEGFAAWRDSGRRAFKSALSIEMEASAHQTLRLRSFYRQFPDAQAPEDYYRYLRGEITLAQLYDRNPVEAERAHEEAWCIELCEKNLGVIRTRIDHALADADPWVLLGGPPCQPFSLAGRSRNRKGTRYSDGKETRHELYVEYLQIIADFWPAVFVMENVRGLLSARFNGQRMFDRIAEDLRDPAKAISDAAGRGRRHTRRKHTYRLFPVAAPATDISSGNLFGEPDFLVRCERHGIPQARHRLILLGVRDDIGVEPNTLQCRQMVPARYVLDGLPKLRSGLSREDSDHAWRSFILSARDMSWLTELNRRDVKVYRHIKSAIRQLVKPTHDKGADFVSETPKIHRTMRNWFLDPRLNGVCNHQSRGHMATDLHRYLFTACFGEIHNRSATLADFPEGLLPDHKNATPDRKQNAPFADRFRVQLADLPSTTIVSHIAKDGHYYIHPDPTQCRSLTVREAARLQTFPDNYRFVGNRTAQYHQVGNAVPPLLAHQIADIVYDLIQRSGLS
ncbi:MAG: DNA (cytosine-5-)-methyltransferase [Phycisphaerales bacterium]